MAASLVLFLYAFLRIGLWHGWIKTLFWCWIAAQFGLTTATVQSLVRDFRAQRRDGQPSPFFSSPDLADPSAAP